MKKLLSGNQFGTDSQAHRRYPLL